MDARCWMRWLIVALGMALVVGLTLPAALRAIGSSVELRDGANGGTAASPVANASGSGPVTDGSAPPIADFVAREGTVAEVGEAEFVLADEPGSAVILAFPVIPGEPTCVGDVYAELTVLEATPTELASFGSAAYDADNLANGSPLPSELLIGDEASWKAFTDGSPGRLRWELTSVYRNFLTSQDTPADAPFVAAITPSSPVEPGGGVRFVASESDEAGPMLSWTGIPDCEAA